MKNTDREEERPILMPSATSYDMLTVSTVQTVTKEQYLLKRRNRGVDSPVSEKNSDSDSDSSEEARCHRFSKMGSPTINPVFSPVNPMAPTVSHKVWPEGILKKSTTVQSNTSKGCCVIM